MAEAIVVGAGLAGLACAVELAEAGREVVVLEASDGVGGRVRTDEVDGFLLDRGFQIYLTAYPEGRRMLDYEALDLQAFRPGALVRHGGTFHLVGDPVRRPADLPATLRAPIGSLADKLRVGWLWRLRFRDEAALLAGPDVTTADELSRLGFGQRIVERFWRPLFAGIQLDPELAGPGRVFRFVFAMLAAGDAAVPAAGMQAIPHQLVARLPEGAVRLGARVTATGPNGVILETGERLEAGAVVVATDGPSAARLTAVPDPGSRGVSCVYFAAVESPLGETMLVLDGEGEGPVNNLAVMSDVAPSYAPPGQALVAAACVPGGGEGLEEAARAQLRGWFGAAVDGWRHLRTYHIDHAQPAHQPPFSAVRPSRLPSGEYVAGDHVATASINGALASGARAAHAVLADAG